jgi:hypothetical protein
MSGDLPERCRRLLALAQGLDEPDFDAQMGISNWPAQVVAEIDGVVEAMYRSGDPLELRACADVLKTARTGDIPEGLQHILARALFDNPETPLSES